MMRPPPYPAAPLLLLLLLATKTHGGCEFPAQWQGRWFQSGIGILQLNRSSIETKGECVDNVGDKFVVHDRAEDCYRCMVIHEKHAAVLQYKETYCDTKASLQELCYAITGDAPLFSMFRKWPESRAVACPFKAAPFTFSYNRGSGECGNPPSRAESCTDDSRLVLKYQACPDIQSTESNVEELVCVATWKEGSTRYLVGRITQTSRRSALSDEDQYRCFIYERVSSPGGGGGGGGARVMYHVAQSGDATCNGLQSAVEGSRTMRLSAADARPGKCRFPAWTTDHHTWLSLDHRTMYRFSMRNATLRILAGPHVQANTDHAATQHKPQLLLGPAAPTAADIAGPGQDSDGGGGGGGSGSGSGSGSGGDVSEVRVVCHSILQSLENRRVQIVAHVTRGCESGYVCMVFHKRDASVIEIQQPEGLHENPDDACRYFESTSTPFTTLISPTLHSSRCPHPGRYTVLGGGAPAASEPLLQRRKKRQDGGGGAGVVVVGGPAAGGGGPAAGPEVEAPLLPECLWHDYEALNVGCGVGVEVMEFRARCQHQPVSAYTCHGSWQENNTHFLIASPIARKSTDALRYCLVYTFDGETAPGTGPTAAPHTPPPTPLHAPPGTHRAPHDPPYTPPPHTVMRLSGLADSCHRFVQPGNGGLWRFNFTTNGGCTRGGETGAAASLAPETAFLALLLLSCLVVR